MTSVCTNFGRQKLTFWPGYQPFYATRPVQIVPGPNGRLDFAAHAGPAEDAGNPTKAACLVRLLATLAGFRRRTYKGGWVSESNLAADLQAMLEIETGIPRGLG